MIWVYEQEIQVANIPSERWSSYNFRVQIKTISIFFAYLICKDEKVKKSGVETNVLVKVKISTVFCRAV